MSERVERERRAFRRCVLERPYDRQAWLVYADWLEEQGDVECVAWRWLVERGKRPYLRTHPRAYRSYEAAWEFVMTFPPLNAYWMLPPALSAYAGGMEWRGTRVYRTVGHAFLDVAAAFACRYREGWRPTASGTFPSVLKH